MVLGFGNNNNNKKPGFASISGCTALVTGASGFCGARLVEMLLERGASKVIAFDIAAPSPILKERFDSAEKKGQLLHFSGPEQGDLTCIESLEKAFSSVPKIDAVYHIAALVGPFHPSPLYRKVNVEGTRNVIDMCLKHKVPKLINSSSPSTRFDGNDVSGKREDELEYPQVYTAEYAETKAEAERMVTAACDSEKNFKTINVAPHQVYGPHDGLFLPSLLSTMGSGRLRIFGKGNKKISVCYVDNYCHGLLCGADAISSPESKALGKFYIITDTKPQILWDMVNEAGMAMGFNDLTSKMHLPVGLLYCIAYICKFLTILSGKKFKLTPFTVRMMTIDRYFSPLLSKRDLGYEPLYEFEEGWKITIDWFQQHWLPQYLEQGQAFPSSSSKQD